MFVLALGNTHKEEKNMYQCVWETEKWQCYHMCPIWNGIDLGDGEIGTIRDRWFPNRIRRQPSTKEYIGRWQFTQSIRYWGISGHENAPQDTKCDIPI